VVVISTDVEKMAEELNRGSVDEIFAIESPSGLASGFNHEIQMQAVEHLFNQVSPKVLLMPHSVNGWDYAPAVSSRFNIPLISDVIDFQPLTGESQGINFVREMFDSKVEAHISPNADQYCVTLRPGEWSPAQIQNGSSAIQFPHVEFKQDDLHMRVVQLEEKISKEVDLTKAEFIVSIGRGIEEEDNLELIKDLVDKTGMTLGASRPITDNGWLPDNRQIGQSGVNVSPRVYLAFGISGAVQHVAGIKQSDTIIAINNDPDAPIFNVADYGIVGDLFDIVPELIKRFY